jgi:hypothetical protein
MKKLLSYLVISFMAFTGSGCSEQYWAAQAQMFKAEGAFMEAGALKARKANYEDRLPYYKEACDHFLKAYQLRPKLFTWNRIQEAQEACWRIKNDEGRQVFIDFEKDYVKKHPTEYEYGEAGVSGVADNL